jgi:hypothetical protein
VPNEPLIAGPRWYRARIRVLGPLLGLVPMGLLGAVAWLSLRIRDDSESGMIGLVAGVSAAPGLLFVGVPFADDSQYPIAVLASIPMWLLLGWFASRRATRSTIASWRDYWREMTYLTLAVVVGAIAALVAATSILGESLVDTTF